MSLALSCLTGGTALNSFCNLSLSSCDVSKKDILFGNEVRRDFEASLTSVQYNPQHLSITPILHKTLHKGPKEISTRPRRHSSAVFQTRSIPDTRQRRLSHDTRDDPNELLEGLHIVANGRCSNSSSRTDHSFQMNP